MATKKTYQKFTDKELMYIYMNLDFDANPKTFDQIDKKIRKQTGLKDLTKRGRT